MLCPECGEQEVFEHLAAHSFHHPDGRFLYPAMMRYCPFCLWHEKDESLDDWTKAWDEAQKGDRDDLGEGQ